MTDNWDETIEPARVALEALIKRGDEITDYIQKLQTKVFLQEKHIWELEATTRQQQQEIDDILKVLADIVLLSVLMPILPDIECVPKHVMDRARMMIDHSDVSAAAARAALEGRK